MYFVEMMYLFPVFTNSFKNANTICGLRLSSVSVCCCKSVFCTIKSFFFFFFNENLAFYLTENLCCKVWFSCSFVLIKNINLYSDLEWSCRDA